MFLIIALLLLSLFGAGIALTGGVVSCLNWVVVLLPCGMLLLLFGLMLCATLVFFRSGLELIHLGLKMILPVV